MTTLKLFVYTGHILNLALVDAAKAVVSTGKSTTYIHASAQLLYMLQQKRIWIEDVKDVSDTHSELWLLRQSRKKFPRRCKK